MMHANQYGKSKYPSNIPRANGTSTHADPTAEIKQIENTKNAMDCVVCAHNIGRMPVPVDSMQIK